jgi:hypothetical protein
MLQDIIETLKEKPILNKEEPTSFKVIFSSVNLPDEEPHEFNFDLFKGKLQMNHLESVITEPIRLREEFQEEREEEEESEDTPPMKTKKKTERTEVKEVREISKRVKTDAGIADVKQEDWKLNGKLLSIDQLPITTKEFKVKLPPYFMNNREKFVQSISAIFDKYKQKFGDLSDDITCDNLQNDDQVFSLLNHQRVIQEYLQNDTPYRGLLVFHSLGAGKTASSIAVAESLKDDKKIYILTPASLEKNYRAELKKAGDPLYRINQCWEWVSANKKDRETIQTLSSVLNLPIDYIVKQGGAWIVNIKKGRNCLDEKIDKEVREENSKEDEGTIQELINIKSQSDYASLNRQIDKMIETKYEFIHYNGLRSSTLKRMTENYTINIFDDSGVIIDEAHNFISRIVNKLSREKEKINKETGEREESKSLSIILYKMLLKAKNTKIVLLTGTPIINYPNEIAILFNILRGYITTLEITLDSSSTKSITKDNLIDLLIQDKGVVDYLDYNGTDKKLIITRNPFGFSNKIRDGNYKGVVQSNFVSDEDYIQNIKRLLRTRDINMTRIVKKNHLALPDKLEDFTRLFTVPGTTQLKNIELFQRRILGLTSYFKSEQEKLLPKYEPSENFRVIDIPMSDYQFNVYEKARSTERKQESNQKKQQKKPKDTDIYTEPSSTYRIFSRLFCNFVMPDEIGRPLPKSEIEVKRKSEEEGLIEDLLEEEKKLDLDLDNEQEGEIEADEVIERLADESYSTRIQNALKKLKKNSSEYLSETGLKIYGPKFLAILKNIKDEDKEGLHLLYSQFRSIEGVGIFKLVLDQNGFHQFKITKNEDGVFSVNVRESRGRQMYALYTGTETTDEKEMVRLIFNGEWDKIPRNIADELSGVSRNNNMGQIIKLLIITASGSEGINLRNTRYVHIMEPYWHPARIDQVIGRARRICSHKNLDKRYQTVEAFIYLMTITPEQLESDTAKELKIKDLSKKKFGARQESLPYTSDQMLYEISLIKREISDQIITVMKETSIDCQLYQLGSKLNCIKFGNEKTTMVPRFSYIPDIEKEHKDEVAKMNKTTEVLTGLGKFEYKGEIVIARKIGKTQDNNTIYEFYSKESYDQVKAKTRNNLIKIMTVFVKGGKVVKELKIGDTFTLDNGETYEVTI